MKTSPVKQESMAHLTPAHSWRGDGLVRWARGVAALALLLALPATRSAAQYCCTVYGIDANMNDTSGGFNSGFGACVFGYNNGNYNTAIGGWALFDNTLGNCNTASGYQALYSSTTSDYNTASGIQALYSNTTGSNNTACGAEALYFNTTGELNTASGYQALYSSTTGNENSAFGTFSLYYNTTGFNNTASGYKALHNNTTGFHNTANGSYALHSNTTGSNNIALGFGAGENLTTGSDNIDIFDPGNAGESDTIRIGTAGVQTNAFMAGISGATVAEGVAVYVDANGQLGTLTSSRRFKEDIQPMNKASEAILALQPVSFRYKHELDPQGIPQFGLVAEEVEKLDPDLVARDAQGKAYTVRYEAVNAMLLNEFLKEHRRVEQQNTQMQELEATVARQQSAMEALTASLKAQEQLMRKMSDRLEATQSAR
jgi:uncharacterized coiled-coil protein SlyX